MLHKESSDLRCVICGSPADKQIDAHVVCSECAEKDDIKEYLDRLTKFE
jgi:DNA-directed RNA polymerase subunit RPC12/RpoP